MRRKPPSTVTPENRRAVWSPSVCPSSVSVPSALAALAPVASCVSGLGGGEEEEEGLAGVWAGFTPSLVPQIKKAEMDRKTLDWEIVELTNKLLDAKNTINRLEELNVRASRGPASPAAGSVLVARSPGQGWALNHVVSAGAVPAGLQPGCTAAQVQQVPLPQPQAG